MRRYYLAPDYDTDDGEYHAFVVAENDVLLFTAILARRLYAGRVDSFCPGPLTEVSRSELARRIGAHDGPVLVDGRHRSGLRPMCLREELEQDAMRWVSGLIETVMEAEAAVCR